MDLLIIKCGTDYMRFKDNMLLTVGLDRASVFPMDHLDHVKGRLKHVQDNGFPSAAIYRLTLSEAKLED